MGCKVRGILSPVRLPVPPLRHRRHSSPSTHPESIALNHQTHFVKRKFDLRAVGPIQANLR